MQLVPLSGGRWLSPAEPSSRVAGSFPSQQGFGDVAVPCSWPSPAPQPCSSASPTQQQLGAVLGHLQPARSPSEMANFSPWGDFVP